MRSFGDLAVRLRRLRYVDGRHKFNFTDKKSTMYSLLLQLLRTWQAITSANWVKSTAPPVDFGWSDVQKQLTMLSDK